MNRVACFALSPFAIVILLVTPSSGAAVGSDGEPDRALAAILTDLESPDRKVSEEAAQKLSKMTLTANRATVTALARLLPSNYTAYLAAEKALTELGAKAVPFLADILLDKKTVHKLRCKILGIFEAIGPEAKAAIPAILERVKDPDLDGNESPPAERALVATGPAAVPYLVKALPVYGEKGQEIVAEALARIVERDVYLMLRLAPPEYEQAIPTLVQGLASPNRHVRLHCLKALGFLRPASKDTILTLAKMANEEDVEIKGAAADALGLIGPPAKCAAPSLQKLLEHSNGAVLIDTLLAIERIGLQQECLPQVTKLAADPKFQRIGEQSMRLLGQVTNPPPDAFKALEKWLANEENGFISLLAAESLVKLNPKHDKAKERLFRGCQDKETEFRALATRLLPSMQGDDERIAATLGKLLDDPVPAVSIDAALSIWRMKGRAKSLIPKLEKASQKPPHYGLELLMAGVLVRLAPDNAVARQVFKRSSPEALEEFLMDLLTQPFKRLRLFGIEVAESLEVLPPAVERRLVECTRDEDADVRQAALALIKRRKQEERGRPWK
jgi:HEAT repeat protein